MSSILIYIAALGGIAGTAGAFCIFAAAISDKRSQDFLRVGLKLAAAGIAVAFLSLFAASLVGITP